VTVTVSTVIVLIVGWLCAPVGQRFVNWLIPPGTNYKLAALAARLTGRLARSEEERAEATDLLGSILASDPARLDSDEAPEISNPLAVAVPVLHRCVGAQIGRALGSSRLPLRLARDAVTALMLTVVPTSQAGVAIIALSALALMGHGVATLAVSVVVLGFATTLAVIYAAQCRRFGDDHLPPHRRARDRGLFVGWLTFGLSGAALATLTLTLSVHPVTHAPRFLASFVVAVALASTTVFLSTLCDWYVVLPRLAGIVCLPPCREPGHRRWRTLTQFWYLHRSIATAAVGAAVVACPLYVAFGSHGAAATAWGVTSVITGLIVGYMARLGRAAHFSLNPPLVIGDVVSGLAIGRLDREEDGAFYLVDVSLAGAHIRWLNDDGPAFARKGLFLELSEQRDVPTISSDQPVCADRCRGVNWYCRHNCSP